MEGIKHIARWVGDSMNYAIENARSFGITIPYWEIQEENRCRFVNNMGVVEMVFSFDIVNPLLTFYGKMIDSLTMTDIDKITKEYE